jgi:uncharacterized protein (DUF952 family)
MTPKFIYKLFSCTEWGERCVTKNLTGTKNDEKSGFIHLATSTQIKKVALKHYPKTGLLIKIDFKKLTELYPGKIKLEPSSSGEMGYHLYDKINHLCVKNVYLFSTSDFDFESFCK